jgi:DNA-binding HxlR family transcriptional regulator
MREHHFEIEDAVKYGVEKAILLYNLKYWVEKNKANRKNKHKHSNGVEYYWTFNSGSAFGELFPYMNERSIRRWLQELEEEGVIISNEFNTHNYDRTKWYSLPKYAIALDKMTNGVTENDQPIPDINTDKKHSLLSDESDKTEINEYLKFPLPPDWSDDSFVDSDGTFIPRFTDNFGRPIKQSEITSLRNQFKAKKTPVRRDTFHEDEVVELWNKFTTLGQNGVPRVCENPSCSTGILPESRLTPDIKTQIKKHAYKYKEISLWELAFKNYAKEIMARWEDDKGYFKHRMSLYEFLLQKNGFIKYVNR